METTIPSFLFHKLDQPLFGNDEVCSEPETKSRVYVKIEPWCVNILIINFGRKWKFNFWHIIDPQTIKPNFIYISPTKFSALCFRSFCKLALAIFLWYFVRTFCILTLDLSNIVLAPLASFSLCSIVTLQSGKYILHLFFKYPKIYINKSQNGSGYLNLYVEPELSERQHSSPAATLRK